MKFKIIFLSTCIDERNIYTLLTSIAQNNYAEKVCIIFLAQNGLNVDIQPYQTNFTRIVQLQCTEQVSSSKSRNMVIDYVLKNDITADFVMYPDDDSSFDKHFFDNFSVVHGNTLICTFCADQTERLYLKAHNKKNVGIEAATQNKVGSWNMIIAYDTFKKVGQFDECLGVGALYGAGEDGDYYIRCCKVSGCFAYTKALRNYHPSPNYKYDQITTKQMIKRFSNYGQGVVFMFCKHHLYRAAFNICIRAIGGVVKSLLQGNIRLSVAYMVAFFIRIKQFFILVFINSKL
jgi:hypothetical protein